MIERNVTLLGRLTADAERKSIGEKATPTLALRVAVNHKDGDKEWTEYVNANIWGEPRVAKWVEKAQLKKGAEVLLTGQEESRQAANKAGELEIYRTLNVVNIRVMETIEQMAKRRAEREETETR